MMSSEEKEKEIEEMREFLALQAAKGETYFPLRYDKLGGMAPDSCQ